jgi:NifU-like protein involved in Fe-S cluster formation
MTIGQGQYMNPRHGDVVKIAVDVTDGRIAPRQSSFSGCASIPAVMNELMKDVSGKTPEEASRIEARELIDRLRLSPDDERCALTAIAALRAALVDAYVKCLP